MADIATLLQGRVMYLEQENSYLLDLLERYYNVINDIYNNLIGDKTK